jgi:hypothetical protein
MLIKRLPHRGNLGRKIGLGEGLEHVNWGATEGRGDVREV